MKKKSATKGFQFVGLLLCALFLLSAALPVPVAASGSGSLEGFDDFVLEAMKDWDVPGAAVVIVKEGEVIFQEGFGVRDIENKLPVTENTLFGIGSSTKAFTAALLLTLVEEGKLSLDQPVQEYLPAFTLDDRIAASMITARDLLAHRAGLPRYDATFMFNEVLTRDHVMENLRHMKPVQDLRSAFLYTNYGYMLAAVLYEELAGISWEEGMGRDIFSPLNMSGSNLTLEELLSDPDFSKGYYLDDGQPAEVPYLPMDALAPAGSINAGVADMAKWLKFNIGALDDASSQPISAMGLQAMRTPVVPTAARIGPHISHQGYGLGWLVESYRGYYHVHHGGVTPGYSALVSFLPEEDLGIAVLCNHSGSSLPQVVSYTAMDRLLGLEPVDWNKQTLEMAKAQEDFLSTYTMLDKEARKTGTRPTHALDDYTGTFGHPLYGTFKLTREDNGLHASYQEASIPLEHWHYDVFTGRVDYFMPLQFAFHFMTDIHGNLNELQVDLDPFSTANPVTFTRLPELEKPDLEILSGLTGEYEVMGVDITIHLSDTEQLIMSVPGQPDWNLEPVGGLRFDVKGLPGYAVEFKLDEQKKEATVIILIQPHGTFSGKRN